MPAGIAKSWCFTLIADEKKGQHLTWRTTKEFPLDWLTRANDIGLVYLIAQVETAPTTGKVHLQGYIVLKDRTSMPQIKKILSASAHWEVARGTPKECWAYCTKAGAINGPFEFGTLPDGKGSRSDIKRLHELVKAQKTDYEILEENPKFAKFEKNMMLFRRVYNEKASDRQATGVAVYVIYGPSDKGKTYAAVNFFGKDNYYVLTCPATPGAKLWFDCYNNQKVLILDDFQGDFVNFRYLLRLLDKYRMLVEVKGGHAWAQWDTVVITTNVHPAHWYTNVDTAPLRRRINEIRYMEERGLYQIMDWEEHRVGDVIAYETTPVASTSAAGNMVCPDTPKMSTSQYTDDVRAKLTDILTDTQKLADSPVQRKRLRRQDAELKDTDKGKEKEKQKDNDFIHADSEDEFVGPTNK